MSKQQIILGLVLLAIVGTAVWFLAGREPEAMAAPTTGGTIEREAVNKGEERTTQKEEDTTPVTQSGPTQESMVREEILRNNRDIAIKNLKGGN